MACTSSDVLADLNKLSLFGEFQEGDIISIDQEEEVKKQKFIEAQRKKEKEIEKQAKLKKEEEIAFRQFFECEEKSQKRVKNKEVAYYSPKKSVGRGILLNGASNGPDFSSVRGRGRGRISPQVKDCLPLLERAQNVQKNISQLSEPNIHSNQYQKFLWSKAEEKEEDDGHYTPENCSPDSSSTSDQYELACGTSESSSPQSFTSVPSPMPSAASFDPILHSQPRPITPLTPRPRKPKGSRLAAKFSNCFEQNVNKDAPCFVEQKNTREKETIGTGCEKEDDEEGWGVLGSSHRPLAPSYFRNGHRKKGMSFNSLNPSQRVLASDVLQQDGLFNPNVSTSKDFTLNMKDFPAL